jgi:hypothetical protein
MLFSEDIGSKMMDLSFFPDSIDRMWWIWPKAARARPLVNVQRQDVPR